MSSSGSLAVLTVEPGTNVSVNDTDPRHPVVSATGGGGGTDGITATGSFDASDTSGFTGASYQVDFDHDRGSAPGIWRSNAAGQGVDVLVAGAFDAHASATISSADPGDVFKMVLGNGGGGDGMGICYGIADSAGNVDLGAHCATGFALSATTPLFTVTLIQISGTGIAPNLGGVLIDLQQVSWNGN